MTEKHPISERQKRQAALLEEALSRPGVAEMMAVYENWREHDRELDSYRWVTAGTRRFGATNHTNVSHPPYKSS